jgi:hypothetical protein
VLASKARANRSEAPINYSAIGYPFGLNGPNTMMKLNLFHRNKHLIKDTLNKYIVKVILYYYLVLLIQKVEKTKISASRLF